LFQPNAAVLGDNAAHITLAAGTAHHCGFPSWNKTDRPLLPSLAPSRFNKQDLEDAHVSGIQAAVSRQLLPAAGPLSARLHNLNAYGAGGFFKSPRDTPRGDPGFVGSLVVCLPVAHEGDGLRVSHSGRSVVYEWGPLAAAGEVQWAAFFPDCEHEVLPVTAGT